MNYQKQRNDSSKHRHSHAIAATLTGLNCNYIGTVLILIEVLTTVQIRRRKGIHLFLETWFTEALYGPKSNLLNNFNTDNQNSLLNLSHIRYVMLCYVLNFLTDSTSQLRIHCRHMVKMNTKHEYCTWG